MAFTAKIADLIADDKTGLLAKHDSWGRVPLSEVAGILNGAPFDSAMFGTASGVPLARIRDVIAGETSTLYAGEYDDSYLLRQGDFLIGMDGDFNTGYWGAQTALLNQRVCKLTPNIEFYDKKLLGYALPAYLAAINANTPSITVKHLSSKTVGEIELPLPPRAEQTRIVEKLDELLSDLDAGVAELKAAQRKLAQYRQSLLKAAVEGALTADWRAAHGTPQETGAELLQRILTARRARWEQKQLARFAEQGKTPPKGWQAKYPEPVAPDFAGLPQLPAGWVWASVEQIASDEPYALAIGPFGSNLVVPDYRDKGVPLVFVRNIRSKIYGGSATKFVTPEKANELKAHQVTAGDVLVTKMGEPPGDADVYPVGQPMAVITADCIKIRPAHELIDPHYLAAVINSPWGIEQIKPMTQGVAQKKVSLGRFSGFVLPLPSKAEQDVVVALLAKSFTSIEEQDVSTELSLKQAAAQRKNLLKAAFAGQLVPQDPQDEPASALLARIRAAREQAPPTRGRKRTGSTPAPATKSPVPGKRGRKPGALP